MSTLFAHRLLFGLTLLFAQTLPMTIPPRHQELHIPTAQQPTTLDGNCVDFDNNSVITWSENGQMSKAFFAHDRDALLVCIQTPVGQLYERWIGVYLSTQIDAQSHEFAQRDDWSLHVNMPLGHTQTQVGDGIGNYQNAIAVWQGQRTLGEGQEAAEFRLPLYGLHIGECGRPFRIAVAHQWVNAVAEDYFWPDDAAFNKPATWTVATMTNTLCPENLTQRLFVPLFFYSD